MKINIHFCLDNIYHYLKVLKKVIKTETFNVDFHKFIKFRLFCFYYFLHIFILTVNMNK